VIHGDIKPANIITNPNTKLFKLIDWGLSMYYVPGKPKNPSVGTK
jgi:serine/threonine protein kinase